MAIVKSYRNEAGGVYPPRRPNLENGPCFDVARFFARFRGNAQAGK